MAAGQAGVGRESGARADQGVHQVRPVPRAAGVGSLRPADAPGHLLRHGCAFHRHGSGHAGPGHRLPAVQVAIPPGKLLPRLQVEPRSARLGADRGSRLGVLSALRAEAGAAQEPPLSDFPTRFVLPADDSLPDRRDGFGGGSIAAGGVPSAVGALVAGRKLSGRGFSRNVAGEAEGHPLLLLVPARLAGLRLHRAGAVFEGVPPGFVGDQYLPAQSRPRGRVASGGAGRRGPDQRIYLAPTAAV